MEIIHERLEREYNVSIIKSAPTVIYHVIFKMIILWKYIIHLYYDISNIKWIEEPIINVEILVAPKFLGNVIKLCEDRRGVQKRMNFSGTQAMLRYELPMNEVVSDFFDKLKSVSKGFASMDYDFLRYQETDVVKVDVYINGDKVDALSSIMHRSQSEYKGRELIKTIKNLLPRQMFEISIQAAIGAKIIARENVKALRKTSQQNVMGGDITCKRKLLEKQKEGKRG